MRRLAALVALWTVFALVGVAAGFAAVRLQQDSGAVAAGTPPAKQPLGSQLTGSPPGTPGTATALTPTGTANPPSRSATPPASSGRSGSSTSAPPASGPSTLGIDTAAGYVSATCTSGIIRMSASPNPGWEVDELSAPGRVGTAKFEQIRAPEGEIKVITRCEDGRPDFVVDDSELNPPPDD